MSHLPILPILIPLAAAIVLLVTDRLGPAGKRAISGVAIAALAIVAVDLLLTAGDGAIRVYRLGDWPAPYGIVLVLDRLAAIMVALTAALAVPVFLAATAGTDTQGRHFHAFLQFQIAGLNGAFLTGDLFNLFVFFEILLLASYGLLVHGGGVARARAGVAYVVLNLCGSALFLIALGLLYGTLGTLNMADVGVVLVRVGEADQAFVRVIAVLLVTVFLLKAALLPLGFWLPQVYTAATLPVAGLFVIMTKVGIYALLRVATIGLAAAPFTADLLQPWLPWLALATIAMGSLGVLAAKRLSMIVANLVVVSAGTLLLGVADLSAASIAALLYYLVQTTMVTGALFLFADALARQRGAAADWLKDGPKIASVLFLGIGYLVLGMAASGAPPLTGFLGKVMVMQSLRDSPQGGLVWAALLVSGLISMLALARAASVFFWESGPAGLERPSAVLLGPAPGLVLALSLMLGAVAALTVAAGPVSAYSRATADQLLSRPAYVSAVIGDPAAILRERRP